MAGVLEKSEENSFSFTTARMCNKDTGGNIHISWIIWYNLSAVKILSNTHIMKDIKTYRKWTKLNFNSGITKTNII